MKTKKMSLANIQGKLSRPEMKNIMAGSGSGPGGCGEAGQSCLYSGCCEGYYCTAQGWNGGGNCAPCGEDPSECGPY